MNLIVRFLQERVLPQGPPTQVAVQLIARQGAYRTLYWGTTLRLTVDDNGLGLQDSVQGTGASLGRSPAMQTIYVSNKGEDKNNRLTSETPVLSWKCLQVLCKGNQAMFLMEGKATLTRLRYELDEGVLHYGISVHTKPRKATE